ncbi:MarR family winged helix-turn-helix transcriptional regulator [Hyphomicrobium sp.]|jgi:DNA-binding MarR family transcriptional regulator|uniref:MarR family winged helix-turn-helix transcriptional regulator n=1 Tax=Hyphomicrobium sp. TaxID=82 RepID=UPI003563944D
MADITSEGSPDHRTASGAQSPAGDEGRRSPSADLIACIELFYFAYRGFTCDPDTILEQYGFGRAHHRVLHFVHRNPGLKVAELLEILKITKQSLARVLKQLVDEGFIIQKAGNEDRRERRLYLSAKGSRLTDKLTQIQAKRIEGALAELAQGADVVARDFLFAMIAEKDRRQVETLIRGQRGGLPADESDCNP